jgi:hypothetical protein
LIVRDPDLSRPVLVRRRKSFDEGEDLTSAGYGP